MRILLVALFGALLTTFTTQRENGFSQNTLQLHQKEAKEATLEQRLLDESPLYALRERQSLHKKKMQARSPLVGQADSEPEEIVYKSDVDRDFDYLNMFLAGFKYEEFIPSSMNCSRYLERSIVNLNDTINMFDNETNIEYEIFNTTEWISYDLAPSSRYCFMWGLEIYTWVLIKMEQFDGFGDMFVAWLQNLLSNAVTFQKLYNKISEANDTLNWREAFFWYGRFTTLFINFDPIPEDELELEDDGVVLIKKNVPLKAASAVAGFLTAGQNAMQDGKNVDFERVSEFNSMSRSQIHPQVQGWFTQGYAFTMGLLNGTFENAAPSSEICQTNITRIINSSMNFMEQIASTHNETLMESAVSFEGILASVHPITFSCYRSFFEYGAASEQYVSTMSNWRRMTYNMIHKAGRIYDTIFFLYLHHETDTSEFTDYENDLYYYKMGIYYGTVINLFLHQEVDTVPTDPLAEVDTVPSLLGWTDKPEGEDETDQAADEDDFL